MVAKSCDHTLDPRGYNETKLIMGNGVMEVTVRWTWDGVSVYPTCDGPVTRLRAVNTDTVSWLVDVPRARNAGFRTYTIAAGDTVTVQGGQLTARGIGNYLDVLDLNLYRSS